MRPRLVIACQVPPHALTGGADAVIGPHLHLLVLHAPPQPFHAHVIPPAPGAVHTDLDAMVFQESRELLAGELAALVRVEDVRIPVADQRLVDGIDAEVSRQRVRPPPRPHSATRPVEDCEERHNATRHRNARDIRRPHLMRSGNRQIAEQIGSTRCAGCRGLVWGVRYSASMPLRAIMVRTRLRPIVWPSLRKRSRHMWAPASGAARWSSSIRRISARSTDDTDVGW